MKWYVCVNNCGMLNKNLYCKVFLYSTLETEDLYDFIAGVISGKKEAIRTIKTDWGEMDLRENKEYKDTGINDFLFWPYYLDVEPYEGVEQSVYFSEMKDFLKNLRRSRIAAVPSCDFESEL